MVHTKFIHDNYVKYDDSEHHVNGGLTYLNDTLSHDEAKVFFEAARHHGESQFRNRDNHRYVLTYQYHNGENIYTLISVSHDD